MRASTLKAKYPDLWKAVEDQVLFDFREKLFMIGDDLVRVFAHNAAFVACDHVHKHGIPEFH